ncbi:hypothetical protein M662_03290 [Bacillus sp. SB49]|uniref:hypothetical protein n=1 Tax=Bacillus sp. SB49 TaxID=1071080 RepID=UPI00042345D2|nr:hypothetical protein [Bacillus sp. SB49]QHT45577.1 hypothetical protein M662_03290 [Bacillus sp. SB49]
MKFKMDGFDDFEKIIQQMEKGANELENTKSVSFDELFHDGFMKKYTSYSTISEFFNQSPFGIEEDKDFDNIDENELDKYVSENSSFCSWNQMLEEAGAEYSWKKLGF